MNAELDTALRELAERQHSLASKEQAWELGASKAEVERRLESPDWELIGHSVMRLAGSRATFEQRCMAAVLDVGGDAFVTHDAAAALWKLPGFRAAFIAVSRRRNGSDRSTDLAQVHHPRLLPPHHVSTVDGIPVTTVARTIFDLAGTCHPGRTERALDNALSRQMTSIGAVFGVTAELARRGRPGSTVMREFLAERGQAYEPPGSSLERRFLLLMEQAGLPAPQIQVDLGADDWVGRVDFLFPERRLVVEVDSILHHSSALDLEADVRRDRALRAAGFEVLRITEEMLLHRPEEVVARVRAALRAAAA